MDEWTPEAVRAALERDARHLPVGLQETIEAEGYSLPATEDCAPDQLTWVG
jgi:hypothetical protein